MSDRSAALVAEQEALRRDRELRDRDRQSLAVEREAFEQLRARSARAVGADDAHALAERQSLLEPLTDARAEREALAAERDRLARDLAQARSRPTPPPTRAENTTSAPVTIRTESREGAVAFLPGFDFLRLTNPDVVRRRLGEADYPRWATPGRIEGDVPVLFQTDRSGRVTRTAVPTPTGGGLDGRDRARDAVPASHRRRPADWPALPGRGAVRAVANHR